MRMAASILRIVRNDAPRDRQGGLEYRRGSHIGAGQLIHKAIAVSIYTDTKTLLRLT